MYARSWNNLGRLLADRLKRYEEAGVAYRRAIEIDPKLATPWNNLGKLLEYHFGRYEEAEVAYRRATEIDPGKILFWHNLGYLYLCFLENPDEAESAYKTAQSLEPNDLIAASNLLIIHLTQPGRHNEAEAMFETVVAKHPADGASLLRAIRALTKNNLDDATTGLKEALAAEKEGIFGGYEGFYMLALRLAAKQGFGEALLAWMDETSLTDRYWPLAHLPQLKSFKYLISSSYDKKRAI